MNSADGGPAFQVCFVSANGDLVADSLSLLFCIVFLACILLGRECSSVISENKVDLMGGRSINNNNIKDSHFSLYSFLGN